MPRFSLAIPTLGRADTLVHALAALRRQDHPDFEIVVQSNGNADSVRHVVDACGDARIRLFHTDEVLSMTDNWERALANCSGDWITFIGDDDGLLPDACSVAAFSIIENDTELFSWEPFLYYWPAHFDTRLRNTLQAHIDLSCEIQAHLSRPLLRKFYAFNAHYSKLPMMYNSFVKRSLIERVLSCHGRYFFGSSPDLTSGVVNAAFSQMFLKSTRPLSVAGISAHSTGHRLLREQGQALDVDVGRDFPLFARDDGLTSFWNVELAFAADMSLLKETLLADENDIVLDEAGLARAMATAINALPQRYEATRAAIEAMVERLGLEPDEVPIPPKLDTAPVVPHGVTPLGPHEALLVFEGDALRLRTIDDAVLLASHLVPAADKLVLIDQGVDLDGIPAVTRDGLQLTKRGPGGYALVSGWSEPESWGTWSVERESLIRARVPALRGNETVRLRLRYRIIPLPDREPRIVECSVGGGEIVRWEFQDTDARGELEIAVLGADSDVIEIRLANLNARSPLELGLSADHRALGIGVEELRLVD